LKIKELKELTNIISTVAMLGWMRYWIFRKAMTKAPLIKE